MSISYAPRTADTADGFKIRRASTSQPSVIFLVATVQFADESFVLERMGSETVLRHPQWSLAGYGRDLMEAQRDLMEAAQELAEMLRDEDPSALSQEAQKMREFVLSLG